MSLSVAETLLGVRARGGVGTLELALCQTERLLSKGLCWVHTHSSVALHHHGLLPDPEHQSCCLWSVGSLGTRETMAMHCNHVNHRTSSLQRNLTGTKKGHSERPIIPVEKHIFQLFTLAHIVCSVTAVLPP